MNPSFETAGIVLLALLGILIGRVFSALRRPYWMLGYFLPCIAIGILALASFSNVLYFVRPFCWVTTGRARFVVLALAVSMGLTAPLSRLPRRCERVLLGILMIVVVTRFCVLPFLVPALIRERLSNLRTRLDSNGICLQTTEFTCAPAAAVTALRQLGLPAEEGRIAALSYSSPVTGTIPTFLCSALRNLYGSAGLKCEYRRFDSVDQLSDAPITLAVVKNAFLRDHCLAILDISADSIIVADPVMGIKSIRRDEFEKIWRFSGIALERGAI